jgi:hypothetical protein
VTDEAFTNRTKEIERLRSNIENNIHTMLISPRRWGKSSLVRKTAGEVERENRGIRFCFIDLFRIRDEGEFYSSFANALVKATSSKAEEWISLSKTLFKRITPRISMGTDPVNDFEITFDVDSIEKSYEEILDLPERIAEKKGIQIVVCIDEFQNLGSFGEPLLFQKRLRSAWQHHRHVTYILYGSKRHMMMELFEYRSMPFYKFGDVMYLPKISREHLVDYICQSFERTGKRISEEIAGKIADSVKCHPYYCQQLAHLVWVATDGEAGDGIFEEAVETLLEQNAILYHREVEGLSPMQLKLLEAVAKGADRLTTAQAINEYNLVSSSNVVRVKKSLEKKEIVDIIQRRIEFIDPAFELWFKRFYLLR